MMERLHDKVLILKHMKNYLILLLLASLALVSSSSEHGSPDTGPEKHRSILKVDMHLSAFGVESDDFPSIDASIDFLHNSNVCTKTYYNPAYEASTYHLSHGEVGQLLALLQRVDFGCLKKRYRVFKTD
jgi:hypothetical protein